MQVDLKTSRMVVQSKWSPIFPWLPWFWGRVRVPCGGFLQDLYVMFDHKDYRQGIWISNLTCTYFSNGRFQKQHQRPAVFVQKTYGRPAKLCRQSCFLSKSSSLGFRGVFCWCFFCWAWGSFSDLWDMLFKKCHSEIYQKTRTWFATP